MLKNDKIGVYLKNKGSEWSINTPLSRRGSTFKIITFKMCMFILNKLICKGFMQNHESIALLTDSIKRDRSFCEFSETRKAAVNLNPLKTVCLLCLHRTHINHVFHEEEEGEEAC